VQQATATLISLVNASVTSQMVNLTWVVRDHSAVTVYRGVDGVSWTALSNVATDPNGLARFSDSTVEAGVRYGYRLGVLSDGVETFGGEAWIAVPPAASFALNSVVLNPSLRAVSASFSLPVAAPATLAVFDVAGRRLASREVGSLGAGTHRASLEFSGGPPPAGLYIARLSQGKDETSRKFILLR
jgi:hypothetical protein